MLLWWIEQSSQKSTTWIIENCNKDKRDCLLLNYSYYHYDTLHLKHARSQQYIISKFINSFNSTTHQIHQLINSSAHQFQSAYITRFSGKINQNSITLVNF